MTLDAVQPENAEKNKSQTVIVAPIDLPQRDQVVAITRGLVSRSGEVFGRQLAQIPILFDLRGKSAGMFRVRRGEKEFRFNPWIFALHFDTSLTTTVPHEVAHYVVFELFGRHGIRPHGSEWQNVMIALGFAPRTTHNLAMDGVPVRRLKQHTYCCSCDEHTLSSIRHNRVNRGQQYFCQRCRTVLSYVKNSNDD